MTKVLLFDNYDSFSYNLVHLVEKILHVKIDVYKNDRLYLEDVKKYDKIILSPGPGIPDEAGLLKGLIKEYATSKSILGVCLGHQAIAEVFGANLINLEIPFHGIATPLKVLNKKNRLYSGIYDNQLVGHYHSWVVDQENFPECLEVTAVDNQDNIMSLCHAKYDVQGVQFHPESILTTCGEKIIRNWLFG